MAPCVCVSRCYLLFKFDYTRFGLRSLPIYPSLNTHSWSRRGRRYCTKPAQPPPEAEQTEVYVKYIQGLPHLTVPLPSRNEKCRFALKPVSHSVGDLIKMLKSEDLGIDRAAVMNTDGIRIASQCSIESLMDEPFWLHINDKQYFVTPPQRAKLSSEEISRLGDVRALICQLYESLHVGEYHIKKEKELLERLEDLKYHLAPLEERKLELDMQAGRKASVMTWVGLGLMSVQFGILARLTWWEYSWDIMEPVTYFVTYGTAMAAYAYYCVTKQEYNYPTVRDRQFLITIHKRAKKAGFDLDTYNNIRRQIAEVEYDLRRLKDPLNLDLPPQLKKTRLGPASFNEEKTLESTSQSPSILDSYSSNASKIQINKIINAASKKFKK